MGRLSRTGSFVTGTTYGSTESAERLIKLVKGIHRRCGALRPTAALLRLDPDLVTWVPATEVANFLKALAPTFPVRAARPTATCTRWG